METFSYNREIKIATAHVMDVLNNFKIYRLDNEGNVRNSFTIPAKYAHRSRILKSIENRNKTIKLPILAISISGIARNNERMHSLNTGMQFQPENKEHNISFNTAIPFSITYDFELVAKYQDEIDQVMSTMSVSFRPHIYVVWPHPYGKGNIKSKIEWDGNFNVEYPEDTDFSSNEKITASASLIYHTWLFPGIGEPPDLGPIIHNINFSTAENFEYLGGFQYDETVEKIEVKN